MGEATKGDVWPHYRRRPPRPWQTARMRHALAPVLATCLAVLSGPFAVEPALATQPPPSRVLVFTRTTGWHHDSIPAAVAALQRLGEEEGMPVDHSEQASDFTDGNLARYRVVVFANTTGDVLDAAQQAAMEGFVRSGGGFVGLHSAADTEYDWPWYGALVGAWFQAHPPGLQTSRIGFEGPHAQSQAPWTITDELYNYRENPRAQVQVFATVDESDYTGGSMGADHPIAWCHGYDGGRAWYSGLGHGQAMYADPRFIEWMRAGLRYAAGRSQACLPEPPAKAAAQP